MITPAPNLIDPATLRLWLGDGEELALLDVRDGGPFAREHLLLATNLPMSHLEVRVPLVLPRRSVRIVLMDGGTDDATACTAAPDGPAAAAADLLARHGYSQLHVLDGGLAAWRAAGHEVFSGTHVPSKAFGEFVEHHYDTPRISARTLRQWQQEGREVVLVDSRPLDEYRMVSLPGAANCPGAELALRVPALLNSPHTPVVVNCAGRTRSIIGCQSLRNAGLTNPVFALENGTMGWQLAGFEPAKGRDNQVPEPSGEALQAARQRAAEVASRHGVRFVSPAYLASMLADPHRTTYVFDVRLPEAFVRGHRPDSLNAPGGQLVQTTDVFAPVRGARLVLVDEHAVQAVMTAHWLQQMGWKDVFVLRGGLEGALVQGTAGREALGEADLSAPFVSPAELKQRWLADEVLVIDVGDSFGYRAARIPDSRYAMRSGLRQALRPFRRDIPLVFACGDGRLSRHAAQDALQAGFQDVSVLDGGRQGWRAAGLALEPGPLADDPTLLTPTDDMWYPPWARQSGITEAMQQYLTWEVNLLDQLAREPYLTFSAPSSAAP